MKKLFGKNLTNIYTFDELSFKIQNDDFSCLEIGDYIETDIISCYGNDKIKWLFAGFDCYYNRGEPGIRKHHIVMLSEQCFNRKFCMNSIDNNSGGYYNSYMNKIVLNNYYKALLDVFGNHILTYNERHYYSYTNNQKKADWLETNLCLLNEMQLYGCVICGDGHDTVGIRNYQLPLFKDYPYLMQTAGSYKENFFEEEQFRGYWLSSVSNSSQFCRFGCAGIASKEFSSKEYGLRPFFLFY